MKHRTHIKVLEYRTHTSTGTYTTHRYYNTEYTQVLKYKILLLLLLLNNSDDKIKLQQQLWRNNKSILNIHEMK